MKRIDVMVDIETLGLEDNAPVFQIAAAVFDLKSGKTKGTCNFIADLRKDSYLPIEGETLIWWLETDPSLLFQILKKGELSQYEIFEAFRDWLFAQGDIDNTYLWGNGSMFDNRIIRAKMERYGLEYPILYTNDRDMRTIVELANIKTDFNFRNVIKEIKEKKIYKKHNALDDVRMQIEILHKAWTLQVLGD